MAHNPDELNPNHPVVRQAHDHWHKICYMILKKLNQRHIVITKADLLSYLKEGDDQESILIHEKADGLHVQIITAEEGREIARRNPGPK